MGKGANSNKSSSPPHAPARNNIVKDSEERIVNSNTNDMTAEFLRIFTKGRLGIELWNILPSKNEEPKMYEELAEELDSNKPALDPHIRKFEELQMIERIIKPIKLQAKVYRHYFRKKAMLYRS